MVPYIKRELKDMMKFNGNNVGLYPKKHLFRTVLILVTFFIRYFINFFNIFIRWQHPQMV